MRPSFASVRVRVRVRERVRVRVRECPPPLCDRVQMYISDDTGTRTTSSISHTTSRQQPSESRTIGDDGGGQI